MAKSHAKAYFGFDWIVSLVLAIIPFTNIVFGVIIRAQRNKLLLAILNIVLAPIFYVIDLVSILLNKDLSYLV